VKANPRLIILPPGLAISFTFAFVGLLCSHEILRPACVHTSCQTCAKDFAPEQEQEFPGEAEDFAPVQEAENPADAKDLDPG